MERGTAGFSAPSAAPPAAALGARFGMAGPPGASGLGYTWTRPKLGLGRLVVV